MLATVEDDDEKEHVYFVALHGGGAKLAKGTIQAITPKSPLGRALVGKREGDDAEVVIAGNTKSISILKIE